MWFIDFIFQFNIFNTLVNDSQLQKVTLSESNLILILLNFIKTTNRLFLINKADQNSQCLLQRPYLWII